MPRAREALAVTPAAFVFLVAWEIRERVLELTYRPFVEASCSGDWGVDVSTGLTRGRGGAPQPAVEELVDALENGVMTTSCCLLHALGHARQLQLLCRVELLCLNTS